MVWLLFIFLSVYVHGDGGTTVPDVEDFSKLRIKELKTRLSDLGAYCRGCSEKRDFVELLKKVIKDPSLAKKKKRAKKKAPPPPPPTEDAVIEGTADNFDEVVLQSKIPVMVEFFAPWCGHCKNLVPHWKAAAGRLFGKVAMVTVDATIETELASRYEVTGYPTIKVKKVGGDGLEDYKGGREEDHLVKAGFDLVGEIMPTVELSDVSFEPEKLQDGLKTVPKALVAFTDYSCGKPCVRLNKNFMKVIKTLKKKDPKPREWAELYLVDCTEGGCKELGVDEYPKVVYFENAKQIAVYERKTSTIKLLGFAKKPSVENARLELPEKWGIDGEEAVPVLTSGNYKNFFKEHKSTLVFFYAPWCGHCKTAKPDIIAASQELAEQGDDAPGIIAGVDCDTYKGLCSRFKVTSFPTIIYFKNGKKKSDYSGSRDKAGYLDFLADPEKIVEKPQEPFLDTGNDHKVELLGDETMAPFIAEHPSVLVMFYAPWCGHCKSAKPGFAETADELEGSGKFMAAVDCTVHDATCAKYGVKGYPTIKYFENGKPQDYNGGRDANGFTNFMESKSIKKTASKKASASKKTSASQETPSMETPSMETPDEDIAHDEL